MLARLVRTALIALALCGDVSLARADDLAEFNTAVEDAAAHNRVAIGYLRTGNLDLAVLEIDRLREAWAALNERFAGRRPAAFDGNALYGTTLVNTSARLVAVDLMIKMGNANAVRSSLVGVRDDLYALRKSAGIVVLADCVRDANIAMDALMRFNDRALDWNDPTTGTALSGAASAYGDLLGRCDTLAPEAVRASAEFRRLIDGAKASLTLIPKSITERDANLLHRVLIELRSFDNLLAFRFG